MNNYDELRQRLARHLGFASVLVPRHMLADLLDENEALRAALKEHEHCQNDPAFGSVCWWCGMQANDGHTRACRLRALLGDAS